MRSEGAGAVGGVKMPVLSMAMNSRERLGAWLESLREKTRVPHEVRIAVHRCKAEGVAWLRGAHPWVMVVHRRLWWLMLRTGWLRATPKELFVRYESETRAGFVAEKAAGAGKGRKE